MSAATKTMGSVEWMLLLVLSLLWGGSFFFSKVALAELPPFTVVFWRVCLAAIALNVIVVVTGKRMPTSANIWGAFLVMGLLNNLIPFSLIFWGQTQIASGLAAILNSTTPLFSVVLGHVLTGDERLIPNRILGVLLGIGGVTAMMVSPNVFDTLSINMVAQIAVFGAALSYALAGIYGRRFKSVPPLVTASGQVTATTIMMLPVMLLADRPWTLLTPGASTVAALVSLALASTALAYIIYFRILAKAGATNLLLVTFLIPVTALILGGAMLGERLETRQFAGMVLIALGLAAIDGRPLIVIRRLLERRQQPQTLDLPEDYQI
jgi:drug/metabolite transporter (DMT)-like permease